MNGKKMTRLFNLIAVSVLLLTACTSAATPSPFPVTEEFVQSPTSTATVAVTETASLTLVPPTETFTPAPPTETFTPLPPTETSTATAAPITSLKAKVNADLLSCRYGPGSEYLYLIAFRKTTPVQLIGRTSGTSNWVLVQNSPQKCWVNLRFLDIAGDPKTLPIMYPDGYKLPVTQYYDLYGSPIVFSAVRDAGNRNNVTVDWGEIRLRAGDEEDENMFIYIIEVWRCQGGEILFEALASNYPQITFVDEPGCAEPSRGRVFFQEKHGYTGPTEIPWPAY
jgi:hypothetical protein